MITRPNMFARKSASHTVRPTQKSARSVADSAGSLVEVLEPRQMMAADLGISVGDAFAPLAFYVPGETVTVPFAVRNNGIDPFSGKASVVVRLTNRDGDSEPVTSATAAVVTMSAVASDGIVSGNATFTFTSDLDAGFFNVSLEVTPLTTAGVELEDEWLDDNTVQSDQDVQMDYVAGNYGGRTGLVMRLQDGDGTDFTVAMTGGGYARFDDGVISDNTPGLYLFGVSGIAASAQPSQTLTATYIADQDPKSDDTIDLDAAGLGVFDGYNEGGYSTTRLAAIVAPNVTLSTLSLDALQTGVPVTPIGITLRDIKPSMDFGGVSISRPVGAFTVRDITGSVSINSYAGAIRVNNINEGSLNVDGVIASLTAQDLTFASVSVNFEGTASRTAVPVTLRDVSDSAVAMNLQLSTVTVRKWLVGEGFPLSGNYLAAVAIGTLSVTTAPTTADASLGSFAGDVFVTGGINRPTQLGTVTIAGVLSGSLFVNGSVGAVTARTVDTGAFSDPSGGWAPTMAVNGSILSFTSTDVRSGAIWANSIRTASLTVASNERNFEIAAGFRASRDNFTTFNGLQILSGSLDGDGSDRATFRSGLIGTLNLTLRPTVTDFAGRFAAGLDVTSIDLRDIDGYLDFAAAADAGSLVTPGPTTGSRINAINVTGVVSNTTATIANSLQFAAITFPAAQFTYGTSNPAVRVTIPAAGATPTPGAISGITPANTFFRIGRPTG